MASPNATFTEIVTTTLRNHPSMMADNVSNHNALWRRLSSKGNVEKIDGGYEIVEPLEYAENATYQRYSGFEPLNVSESDVLTSAKFDWKQAAVHIVASGLQLRQNSGRNQIISLSRARMRNAMKTFANNISVDIYSDGTADNSKQIGGLDLLITQAGTGTVGGIDSSTNTFWANQFKDGAGATAATIGDRMRELWLLCQRQGDVTDFIVADTTLYTLYWNGLTDLQRYTSRDDVAGDGFAAGLKFNTADIFHDTTDSGIGTNEMFFLNTDYIKMVMHTDADIRPLDEKAPVNQDGVAIPVIFQGNMVVSNRARQGILFD